MDLARTAHGRRAIGAESTRAGEPKPSASSRRTTPQVEQVRSTSSAQAARDREDRTLTALAPVAALFVHNGE